MPRLRALAESHASSLRKKAAFDESRPVRMSARPTCRVDEKTANSSGPDVDSATRSKQRLLGGTGGRASYTLFDATLPSPTSPQVG